MKTPKKKSKREPPSKPGGKALERLHQFEQERGLEQTDIQPPEPVGEPAEAPDQAPEAEADQAAAEESGPPADEQPV